MALKLIAGVLFAVWMALVLLGKGGFVHLILLNAIGVATVELMTILRTRMTVPVKIEPSELSRHQTN